MHHNRNRYLKNRGDDKDDSIAATLEQKSRATVKEVAEATGLRIATARYRLLTLELAGAVKSEKARNRVHYYLVEEQER